ncbi:hypothetical protein IWQ56_006876, partial [Coemansia nantahalensis]
VPQGAVPDRRAPDQLADVPGPQQRQEADGDAHRPARVRDYPPADRPEPDPGPGGRDRQHRPARRLDPHWLVGRYAPPGRRCVAPAPRQRRHRHPHHGHPRGVVPQRQDHRRVPRRRADQRRQGLAQLVRHQEEGRAGARGQVQPL